VVLRRKVGGIVTVVVATCAGLVVPTLPLPPPLRPIGPSPAAADPGTSYRDMVLADTPGAYWRLDETSGNLLDTTANANTASAQSPLTRPVPGLVNDATTATGFTGGYGTVADSPSVSPTSRYSLEAWIKPATVNGQMGIIEHYGTQGPPSVLGYNGFGIRVEPGGHVLLFDSGSYAQFGAPGGFDFLTGASRLQAGRTYHVVGTYDGSALRIYLNGLLDASMAATFPVSDSPLAARLGASGPEHAHPFDGTLDELAIYDHALTPSRVRAHYAASGRTPPVNATQTRGWALHGRMTTTRRADPVDTATGAFVDEVGDLSTPATGVPFSFTRTYNSNDATIGPLGKGWAHAWAASVSIAASGDATVRTEDGAELVFTGDGAGGFLPPPAVTSTLSAVAVAGGYELRRADQVASRFDASGRLVRVEDRSGQGVTLAYDAPSGRLATATDASGRVFSFAYDASGKLAALTAPAADGRSVSFAYTGDLLTSVTDVQGGVTAYDYDVAGRLTQVTDPEGNVEVVNTYGADGRVVEQLDPLGNATTFSWDAATETSTMTDPKGKTWIDVYAGNVLQRTTEPAGTSTVAWDADVNPISDTDANGRTWVRTYDGRGNLLTRTAPAPLSSVEAWTYDSAGNPLTYTDGRGNATKYAYDASGRLLTTTWPDETTESRTYTAADQLATVTDGRGDTTTFSYDSAGNVASTTSPAGNVTSWTYDAAGRPLTRTEPRGNAPGATPADHTTTWAYDAAGDVLTETDALGRTTTSTYDGNGNELTRTDALGRVTAYAYDDAGELVAETAPGGLTTAYDHDERGQVVRVTSPGGAITTYAYDDAGRVASMVEPRGNVAGATPGEHRWTYTYDAVGNQLSATDPLGHTTSQAYDERDRLVSVTDANGHTTAFAYDAADNRTSESNHLGQATAWTYDARNRVTSMTNPVGRTWTYGYDANGNLTSETSPLGSVTTRSYDADDRLIAVVDPLGNAPGATPSDHDIVYGYDADGHETTETDALGASITFGFDRVGNRTARTDANGHTTTWTFDALNRLASVTAPASGTTAYGYDTAGDLVTRTDANGHATGYAYDADHRLVSLTSPAGQRWTYGYDAAGNRTTTVDARANAAGNAALGTMAATYDRAGRLVAIDYSDTTPDVTFAYDGAGNRTAMTDGSGTETRTYDAADRLTGVTRGPGSAFAYAYDAAGRVTSRTYPDGSVTAFAYDDDGQLATVAAPEGTTSYGYDRAGRLSVTTLPNGVVDARTYDNGHRLATIADTKGTTTVASFAYTRDPVGNPTQVVAATGTQTYGYDAADRLTSVCYAASCAAGAVNLTSWTYDHVGNRLTETTGAAGRTYTYDSADRLTSSSLAGVTKSYGYDADGNQTTAGLDAFGYDMAGRMTSATDAALATTYAYAYDGDGKRLRTTTTTAAGSTTVADAWDVTQPVPEVAVERDVGGGGAVARRYGYGVDRISTTVAGGASSFYLHDGLGSVTNVTSATGGRQWTYSYQPFGRPRTTTHDDLTAPAQPMRFAGEQLDATGLYHLRARQYDTAVGRFTTTDPLAVDVGDPYVSAYAYANDRPTAMTDPTGEKGRSIGSWNGNLVDGSSTCTSTSTPWAPSPIFTDPFAGASLELVTARSTGTSCLTKGSTKERERSRTKAPPIPLVPPIGTSTKHESHNRGRIQVQGPDMNPELSWPWARKTPPTAREGLTQLYILESSLTRRQREVRDEAFQNAAKYIRGCGRYGGCWAPSSKSFKNSDSPLRSKARVDVEIRAGSAFV
jgi:RHS repeat-associated protein